MPEAMNEPAPQAPGEWLRHLHLAGQWSRLEHFAAERLAADPNDVEAHFHRAWALLKLERGGEAGPHVEYLLGTDPEDASFLKLAAFRHMYHDRRFKQARACLDAALKITPEDATLWYLAAIIEAQLYHLDDARKLVTRARQLDPDDADIAHLHITLHTLEQTGAKAAWHAVREHEKALALDPENDGLIASLGDVFLDELEMPERAEELYRQALALDPSDRRHQKRLWKAMQKRNFFFRTLRLPLSGLTLLLNVLRGLRIKPWLILLFIIAFKFVLLYLAWLLAATVVFAPPALMAGWLVMADLQRASRAAATVGQWWLDFHRLPLGLRVACCVVLTLGFWWGLFALLGIQPLVGFSAVATFFAVHLVAMAVRINMRKSDAHNAAMAARPPPLPPPLPKSNAVPPPLP
jgi:tetratricopeptide (TPR) repeat protein